MPVTLGDGDGIAGEACGVGAGAGDGVVVAAEADDVATACELVPCACATNALASKSAIRVMSVKRNAFVVFFVMTPVTFSSCDNDTLLWS